MNVFFVLDGEVVTPELHGSILPGITRKSSIQLLRDWGFKVSERRITIQELAEANDQGRVMEAVGIFACLGFADKYRPAVGVLQLAILNTGEGIIKLFCFARKAGHCFCEKVSENLHFYLEIRTGATEHLRMRTISGQ